MGDRFVVGFQNDDIAIDPIVFLYSHWGGTYQHYTVADAVGKARNRWGDGTYATRIALSNIIGSGWSSETGWGIYAENNYKNHGADYPYILIVEWMSRRIRIASNDDHTVTLGTVGFDEFIDDPEETLVAVLNSHGLVDA